MKAHTTLYTAVLLLVMAGCARHAATANSPSSFFVTNEVVGDKVTQVIQMTNGISLYATTSRFVVWFGDGYDEVVGFDPKRLKVHKILWNIPPLGTNPGRTVFDINADGIPDIGRLHDASKTRQIFYDGEWHTAVYDGPRTIIPIDGKKQQVYFDGQRWRKEPADKEIVVTNALWSASF